MSIRNDKPNYVTVNSDTYKPIIKYYSYLMPIASISNDIKCVSSEKIIDNKTHLIELDPIAMSYSTFRSFFYSCDSDAFKINAAKNNCFQIIFKQQTVTDEDGTHTFDLLDSILCAYEEETKVSRNSILPKEMIALTKEMSMYTSLFNICGCTTSLKWSEILETLKSNGQLISFDEKICLRVVFNYVNTTLLSKPVTIMFQYDISDIYENIMSKSEEASFHYRLDKAVFSNGTYRITRPGTYILTEDIVFNPNRYDDYKPRADQDITYPRSHGYVLGFFAAITIEATNVIVDLNGYSISLHDNFNLIQRFCALIELASSPFVPKQGPANFGTSIVSAQNVIIKNGTLGQVSHHGIHGNGCKNILIENIEFKDFEVAAISINGGENITVNNCKIRHVNTKIKVLSSYSHAKFGLPKIKQINKQRQIKLYLHTHYDDISLYEIEYKLETEINRFEKRLQMGFPASDSMFYNSSGYYDGNVYGIVFNSFGVVVGDFKPMRTDAVVGNKNITIKNTSIENIISDGTEVASLYDTNNTGDGNGYSGSAFVGGAGDVFSFLDNIDERGYYKGNIIGNMQMAISIYGSDKQRGTANIPNNLCREWITKKKTIVEYVNTNPNIYSKPYSINRDKDSMAHSMKGNIGLFISQGENVVIDNVYINNVINKSKKQERTLSTEAYGIAIVGSKNIRMSDTIRVTNITNPFGDGDHIKYINM